MSRTTGTAPDADHVRQHVARADRGQLIDVAHEDAAPLVGTARSSVVHQQHVHHGSLVDDQQVAFQRLAPIALEPAVPRIELQQPVDRLGLRARRLGQALGRSPRGRGKHDATPLAGTIRRMALTSVVLPTPGPPVMITTLSRSRPHRVACVTASARPVCAPPKARPCRRRSAGHGGPPATEPAATCCATPASTMQRRKITGSPSIVSPRRWRSAPVSRDQSPPQRVCRDLQQPLRGVREGVPGQGAMAVAGRLLQHVANAGAGADGRVVRNAESPSDRVGGLESDAAECRAPAGTDSR